MQRAGQVVGEVMEVVAAQGVQVWLQCKFNKT